MFYYICVFVSGFLVSIGLLLLKKPFFSFALSTVSLLDSMLDSSSDERIKQKKLVRNLGSLLSKFSFFLIYVILILSISIIPILLYFKIKTIDVATIDLSSFNFYFSMILGSTIFFILIPKNQKKDYSDWSVLLHKIVLNNYSINRSLFKFENRLFKRKLSNIQNNFVIVTGLARAGTTALTNLIYEAGNFHSLSYANMPFLLAPNVWKKFYKPKQIKQKERAHGDKVMFGFDSIEALEEYFFKVFLNDSFVQDRRLTKHEIDIELYNAYLNYQGLISNDQNNSIYLAKNNNFILRYDSFRRISDEFKIILIFRNPVAHAQSLMDQHHRFTEMQKKDTFVLDYMNWLGHYEFGINHKYFDFGNNLNLDKFKSDSIDYWLKIWINYYTEILDKIGDKNMFLVEYNDLLLHPEKLISSLKKVLDIELITLPKEPFVKYEKSEIEVNKKIKEESMEIFERLKKYKITVT